MIYHFFNGSMTHFLWIIEGFLYNAKYTNENGMKDHFFVILLPEKFLFGDTDKEIHKYISMFDKYTFLNYSFVPLSNHKKINGIFGEMKFQKDLIVIHGGFSYLYSSSFLIKALLNKRKIQRIIKIEWTVGKINKNTLKRKIKYHVDKYLYTNMGGVIVLTSKDEFLIKEMYPHVKVDVINYMDTSNAFYTYTSCETLVEKTAPLKIIVSHSGWQHNNHIETFHKIEFLKDENVEIICPLCYGDSEYINSVIEVGESIFKRKFTYFTELKEREEYVKLITSSHVYISSANSQTGLFAAIISVSNGLKVFLGDNLYTYFKELGCVVYRVQEIKRMMYKDLLINKSKEIFKKNRKVIIQNFSNELLASKWKIIFENSYKSNK